MQQLTDTHLGESGSQLGNGSAPALESPSLYGTTSLEADGPTAYELKFLLSEDQARDTQAYLARSLQLDPHADPKLGHAYHTTSVYTETPTFDVFRRSGDYARTKLRARRYGHSGPIFLERKDKDGNKVRKCRVAVAPGELDLLSDSHVPSDWTASWYRHLLTDRNLAPICRISYERVAFLGMTAEGIVRATFDRNLRGERTDSWHPTFVSGGTELLRGEVICEFKYRMALPVLFKDLIADLALTPSSVSKYRRFARAVELAGPEVGGSVDA